MPKPTITGLTEAEVAASRREHGANTLTPPKRVSMWRLYLEKYEDPIIRILLVAAAVSLGLAIVDGHYVETIGIIAAIILATTVGFLFERDAARKFDVLTSLGEEQKVKVVRSGRVTLVARRDIVVGDVVLVETGDEIPADGTIISCRSLTVDEASLTGEPLAEKSAVQGRPATASAYPPDRLLRSTMVMSGTAMYGVTAVGDKTEIGRVARATAEDSGVRTPLSMQLDRLGKAISRYGLTLSIGAAALFLAHDLISNPLWRTIGEPGADYVAMAAIVLRYFMLAVSLIVMAVPEGLPMAVTLALALNMRRMLKSHNLVRRLHACETMGAVTVICTDKTGTLTENRMRVADYEAFGGSATALHEAIAVNTTAHLDADGGIGNPTEVALLLWLEAGGGDYRAIRREAEIVSQEPFSTETKRMTTTVRHADGAAVTYLKGAPEMVLDACRLTDAERLAASSALARYQGKAMRTLALACREGNAGPFTLQAVVGISDPLRPDVAGAVALCHRAGIEVKIVTGDTEATAMEIARQIGITDKAGGSAMSGAEFSALPHEAAREAARRIRVMSRARPADKQRLVTMLQESGEIVAVTGDGTNDAPALNHAHVGLSLGSGTNVAKEASDMTLLDDSFRSIANAVMWGRSLYRNIQRFLFFQLVVNVAALCLVLAAPLIGTEMPLTVTQILWVNLIMDTLAALALASLAPSREVMGERPRKAEAFILPRPILRSIAVTGGMMFLCMFAFLAWCERNGGDGISRRELTWFFTTFVMLQVWNLLNARCLGSTHSALRRIWAERGLLLVLALVVVGQWAIVTFTGEVFRCVPLSAREWLCIVLATSPVLLVGEAHRAWKRRLASH